MAYGHLQGDWSGTLGSPGLRNGPGDHRLTAEHFRNDLWHSESCPGQFRNNRRDRWKDSEQSSNAFRDHQKDPEQSWKDPEQPQNTSEQP